MKRICVLGAAVAGLLTAAIPATALATTKPAAAPAATRSVTCTFGLITQPAAGDTAVTPGAASGRQFGNVACKTPLYKGVAHDSFALTTAGDFDGTAQQWFRVGTLSGSFKLGPNSDAPPTPTTFTEQSYVGTVTITGGTGALRGTTGTGTMRCSSTDQVHYACTERLKLTQKLAGSPANG